MIKKKLDKRHKWLDCWGGDQCYRCGKMENWVFSRWVKYLKFKILLNLNNFKSFRNLHDILHLLGVIKYRYHCPINEMRALDIYNGIEPNAFLKGKF